MDQHNEQVGSASALKEWSDWNAGYHWWIQSMYIKPGYRGKGYMDLLLDAIRSEKKKQDSMQLRLYVHENNQAATRAYKKANWKHFSKVIAKVDPSIDNLAIESKDRIFITNMSKNGIYEIDKKTGKSRTVVEGKLSCAAGVAVSTEDGSDTVYITDVFSLKKVDVHRRYGCFMY